MSLKAIAKQGRRVDARIVAYTQDNAPRLLQLQSAGFPFLRLGHSQLEQPYAWFDFDNYAGTFNAINSLVSHASSV